MDSCLEFKVKCGWLATKAVNRNTFNKKTQILKFGPILKCLYQILKVQPDWFLFGTDFEDLPIYLQQVYENQTTPHNTARFLA